VSSKRYLTLRRCPWLSVYSLPRRWLRWGLVLLCALLALALLHWPLARYVPTQVVPTLGLTNCSCSPSTPPAYTAMILDTRASPALEFAIKHMACTLPEEWGLMLVGTRAMRGFVQEALLPLLRSRRLAVWELSPHSKELTHMCLGEGGWCPAASTAPAWQVPRSAASEAAWTTGWDLANQVMISESLLRAIPSEHFLVFQTDGLACRPLAQGELAALLKYDFWGAPWRWDPMGFTLFGLNLLPSSRAAVGGNGGFSFRTRSTVLRILEEDKRRQWFDAPLNQGGSDFEDLYLARRVQGVGGRLPPMELAQAFAVESMLPPPSVRPLGYHKPWMYLSEVDLRALVRVCPTIAESLAWNNASEPLACSSRGGRKA
jgi:hypothetical protein